MKKWLAFDDVLLNPQFSFVKSRAHVDISQEFCGMDLRLPVISSNMDTVTNSTMCKAMTMAGAVGALHRFQSIEDNVMEFHKSTTKSHFDLPKYPIGSFGLGKNELARAIALSDAGCNVLLLDVAHGASIEVVNQVKKLREVLPLERKIIVGNFANATSIMDFVHHLGNKNFIQAVKVGIGGGSACLTRVQTGSGAPTFSSVVDCVRTGIPVISDGGHKTVGDICKALAAGAHTVMLGSMLAGTDESPGDIVSPNGQPVDQKLVKYFNVEYKKRYRGSASQESYVVQGKVAQHRVYEGDSFLVPYRGPVASILQEIEGGLRSALSYSGATNLEEFRERAEFIEISSAGVIENGSHGKK